ncbi:acyl carrier protein [Variovorax ginsengisoli]|uniref:Acyl carrier protein n=1 Tax=Variovorax ginsengisoli TaxID=363844 RepID=A0ABT9S5M9_9BURK|nr:acyl carrier protein [Variovorax ginsengisoli]MDP9899669.1 acyl carrier protein [Variovorax ginsengisoli]
MNSPTFNSIAAILQSEFHLEASQIHADAALIDLGLDSLALMEFVFAVEDAFRLRIPEDRLDPREAGITLQRLCEVIDDMQYAPAQRGVSLAAAA